METPPDPHFGTDEEMLAWCDREGLTPIKDLAGGYDWQAVWDAYLKKQEGQP